MYWHVFDCHFKSQALLDYLALVTACLARDALFWFVRACLARDALFWFVTACFSS